MPPLIMSALEHTPERLLQQWKKLNAIPGVGPEIFGHNYIGHNYIRP